MGKLRITYKKSAIGYSITQKETIRSLGLRKLQSVVEHNDTPAIRGMVFKVRHLVTVEETAGDTPVVKPTKLAPVARPAASSDDLELIEGIGPKIASVLQEAGVTSFAALAAMTPAQISAILQSQPRLRLAVTDTWPQQAALAAAGKMDELKQLQERLNAGRSTE